MSKEDLEGKSEIIRLKIKQGGRGKPDSINEEGLGLLDWDAHIKNPPKPKFSGAIKATFRYVGRSKPIPIYNNDY